MLSGHRNGRSLPSGERRACGGVKVQFQVSLGFWMHRASPPELGPISLTVAEPMSMVALSAPLATDWHLFA